MKRKNAFKVALTLSLTLGLVTLLHKNAYAADAVVDILENDRFNGVVSTVNKIGRVVDTYFMSFISFVSFYQQHAYETYLLVHIVYILSFGIK